MKVDERQVNIDVQVSEQFLNCKGTGQGGERPIDCLATKRPTKPRGVSRDEQDLREDPRGSAGVFLNRRYLLSSCTL